MKKGERRPRAWKNVAPTGRQSEAGIRSQLASISRALRDKNLRHKDRLRYLDHSAQLRAELRAVVQEKLKAKLQELEQATDEQFTK